MMYVRWALLSGLFCTVFALFFSGCVKSGGSGGGSGADSVPSVSDKWAFATPSAFTYDSSHIRVANGYASLAIDSFVDSNNSASGFGGGTFNSVSWNVTQADVELTNVSSSSTGSFLSRVLNASATVSWLNLGWVSTRPTCKPLPGGAQSETGYTTGNADMTSNVLLMHLDETAGSTTFADSSGNANNGGCPSPNCPTPNASGRFNGSQTFASGQYIEVSDSSALTLQGDLALEAWIIVGTLPSGGGYHDIFAKTNSTAQWAGYEFAINSNGALSLWLSNGIAGNWSNDSGYDLSDGNWHHVAASVSGSTLTFYVDGKPTTHGSFTPVYPGGPNSSPLVVGDASYNFPSSRAWNGDIDEVAVFARSLTSSELEDHYLRGALRLSFQVRSCASADCTGVSFVGPDGTTATSFSELSNTTLAPTTYAVSTLANPYFQYSVAFQSDASTGTPFTPQLNSVAVAPQLYDATSPSITSNTGISYSTLVSFADVLSETSTGSVTYQLSNDGTHFYYFDGTTWSPATGVAESNSATAINMNAASFASVLGAGTLYLRAYLISSGSQPVSLKEVDINVTQ